MSSHAAQPLCFWQYTVQTMYSQLRKYVLIMKDQQPYVMSKHLSTMELFVWEFRGLNCLGGLPFDIKRGQRRDSRLNGPFSLGSG